MAPKNERPKKYTSAFEKIHERQSPVLVFLFTPAIRYPLKTT
jgi:hypothetical protein